MSLWPAAIRASAIRAASTPAPSSPMKVRDDPVTPCTIAILPASRFESWARNSVGRKSFIRRSLRKPGAELLFSSACMIEVVDREIAFPAPACDDHVGLRQDFLVALDARRIQRQPGRIGADALPGLHLALVALLRDLGVEIH